MMLPYIDFFTGDCMKFSDEIKENPVAEKKSEDTSCDLYLDGLYNSAEDEKDILKAKARVMTPADKRIITVLSVLNAAIFTFIGIYIIITKSDDPFKDIIREAHFEEGAQFFQLGSVFGDTLNASYEDTEYPNNIKEEFKALYSVNDDTAAWLRIEGTNIDHVVLQGKNQDNNEKYDRATFYGDYYIGGSLYMDYRNRLGNTANGLSKNTIIYGHYLDPVEYGGGMFTDLVSYENLDYYKEHPIIEFNTLYRSYKFKVIAAFVAADSASKDNALFYFWDSGFSSDSTMGFAEECARRSYIRTEKAVDVKPDDRFITLSTCSHTCDIDGRVNARFVVVGRLLRDGESEEVNVDLAYQNENPRMPQLWYDLRGLTNPFADVPIWQS